MSNVLHPRPLTKACHFPLSPITSISCRSCVFSPQRSTAQISGVRSVVGLNVHSTATLIRCMAKPRRVKIVAAQIRRELSDMLLFDKVLRHAVLPEAALGADRYLSSLTTISDVEVTADLQVVKAYVSVFGDERGKEVAIAGLKAKAKYVRSELGRRMKLRLTPEIRFIEDDSVERGCRVIAILDKIKKQKEMEEGQNKEPQTPSTVYQNGSDWEGENTDEDIFGLK